MRVAGGQPHPLAKRVGRSRGMAASLHAAALAKMGLHRGNSNFLFLRGRQGRLAAEQDHEWRHTCGCSGEGVVRTFNPREEMAPGGRVANSEMAETHLQILVGLLCLPIGLGVITKGKAQ